jgi:two-component system response regulator FimZ (fimbrial Z protein)
MTSPGNNEIDSRLAFYAGADAYIGKSVDPSNLIAAVVLAAQGNIIFPNSAVGFLAPTGATGLGLLTKRELRVHQLLAEGLSNIEIASKLGTSRKTVSTFKSRIASKVGLPVTTIIDLRTSNGDSTVPVRSGREQAL